MCTFRMSRIHTGSDVLNDHSTRVAGEHLEYGTEKKRKPVKTFAKPPGSPEPERKSLSQTTMVSCEINAHSADLQVAAYLTAEPLSMPEKEPQKQ